MIGNKRLQKESKSQVKYYETMQTKSLTEYDSGGEERKQLLAKLNFSAMTPLCQNIQPIGHLVSYMYNFIFDRGNRRLHSHFQK